MDRKPGIPGTPAMQKSEICWLILQVPVHVRNGTGISHSLSYRASVGPRTTALAPKRQRLATLMKVSRFFSSAVA